MFLVAFLTKRENKIKLFQGTERIYKVMAAILRDFWSSSLEWEGWRPGLQPRLQANFSKLLKLFFLEFMLRF